MSLDPLVLSRIQFAWVIGWHFLLPAFTVGLASFIAVLEGLNLFTGREIYLRFPASGSRFSRCRSAWASSRGSSCHSRSARTGVVTPTPPPMSLGRCSPTRGLVAFFLEAAFLGVLLFGRKLVPPWAHFVAALMVAFGTLFSTFWILSTNSWMQTPAGYAIVDGRFVPKDWLQIIFSPSFPIGSLTVVDAVYITTGFVVVGVAASYLRQGRFVEEARTMLSMTLWLLTVLVPLQFLLGDAHGLNTLEHQPAKLAAIEAIWDTHGRVPLNLFAIPDEKAETDRYVIAIPDLGSLILTHDPNGVVHGLKDWPANERPSPIVVPFFGFRIMVGDCCRHAGTGRGEPMAALAGRAFRRPLVPLVLHARLAPRLRGRAGWLGDHRSGPSAVDSLWAPAYRRFRVSVADGLRRCGFIGRLLRGLPRHVPRRSRADDQNRPTRSAEEATEPEPIESGRPAQPVQALPSTETGQRR